ncbi:hypothetical protein SB14R_03225 [Pseudomonas oryzihabitans]|nr:hypothetical protein NS376_08055 [Pseudomonas psychrotolerans]KTT26490.1 hypothetical protein SB14R_03225 [Pseudomonas psychrotolerans]KTT56686.1 hypothetical protein SB8_14620 [Pseudomonas psychrotolerans]
MKRSSHVQLSLLAVAVVSVSGCDVPEKDKYLNETASFDSVQQCVDARIPQNICAESYMDALAEYKQRVYSYSYETQAQCEENFVAGYCELTDTGRFAPKFGGFQITVRGLATSSQVAAAHAEAANGSSTSSNNGLLTGLLIGTLLNNGNSRLSTPVFRYRTDRGAFASSSLNSRMDTGSSFSNSNQARTSNAYTAPAPRVSSSYTSATPASRSSDTSGLFGRRSSINTAKATSRGGFGGSAVARASGFSGGSFGG